MGTSVSHPSSSSSSSSTGWSEFQDNISFGGIGPDAILNELKKAFKCEYGENYLDTIVDNGVSIIERFLGNHVSSQGLPAEAAKSGHNWPAIPAVTGPGIPAITGHPFRP